WGGVGGGGKRRGHEEGGGGWAGQSGWAPCAFLPPSATVMARRLPHPRAARPAFSLLRPDPFLPHPPRPIEIEILPAGDQCAFPRVHENNVVAERHGLRLQPGIHLGINRAVDRPTD